VGVETTPDPDADPDLVTGSRRRHFGSTCHGRQVRWGPPPVPSPRPLRGYPAEVLQRIRGPVIHHSHFPLCCAARRRQRNGEKRRPEADAAISGAPATDGGCVRKFRRQRL
jgi:hypothetical protein